MHSRCRCRACVFVAARLRHHVMETSISQCRQALLQLICVSIVHSGDYCVALTCMAWDKAWMSIVCTMYVNSCQPIACA